MSINSSTSLALGYQAEQDARFFLERQGMIFVEQNYKAEKLGEIDLVMQDQEHLVFVEVKLRHDGDFGLAVEMIGAAKRARLIRTAKRYLQEKKLLDKTFCRFDVVAIMPTNAEQITWIKNAFEVQY